MRETIIFAHMNIIRAVYTSKPVIIRPAERERQAFRMHN